MQVSNRIYADAIGAWWQRSPAARIPPGGSSAGSGFGERWPGNQSTLPRGGRQSVNEARPGRPAAIELFLPRALSSTLAELQMAASEPAAQPIAEPTIAATPTLDDLLAGALRRADPSPALAIL